MSIEDILGAFLLVNNPIVLSEKEIKDVQKAIKELQQENQQLKIQISAREEEYKKLEETNKVLSQELTKGNLIKRDHLTTCCGIPIGDIPKLIDKYNKLEDNWNKLKELKEFYINDFEERNITLIPLSNLTKNIDIILKELELERGVNNGQ